MAIIPAGYGQTTYVFAGASLPNGAVCTLGWRRTGIIPLPEAMTTYAASAAFLHESMSTSNCTLVALEFKLGPTLTGPTYRIESGQIGGQGTNAVPPNVAVLVRKTVADTSTRFAGRLFWPSMPEGTVDSAGQIESASVTQFQEAWDDHYTEIVAAGFEPVVLSATSSDPRDVTSLDVQGRVATQRERLRR